MYALVLRKWSLAKILMYLWLPVIMLLVYGCQFGVAMHLTPLRSNQQSSDNINNNNYNDNSNDPSRDVIWYPANQLISQVPNVPIYENSQTINKFSEFNFNLNNQRNTDEDEPDGSYVMRSRKTAHERFERVSDINKRLLTQNNNKRNDDIVSQTNDNRSDEPSESLQRLRSQRYAKKRDRQANHRKRLAGHNSQQPETESVNESHLNTPIDNATTNNDPNLLQLTINKDNELETVNLMSGRNRRESRHQHQPQFQTNRSFQKEKRNRQRRFCSAQDPATLAFQAPTVFKGKVRSMSSDRRKNFSVTFEVKEVYKRQPGFKLPLLLRLQFSYRNTSECNIYREVLRPRGYVKANELEQGNVYILFVEQLDLQNFTILGKPLKANNRIVKDVKLGVSDKYGQRASIDSLKCNQTAVREGRRIRIVCKVRGQPPPKVTWFKDGRSIGRLIGRNRDGYEFVHLRKRAELIIKSAFLNDSGLYECRAKNRLIRRPVSRSLRIEVIPKPLEVTRPPNNWTHMGSVCPVIGDQFCLNGGECVFFKDVGEPACKCPDGFLGNRCETKNPTYIQPSTYNKKEQQQCGDKFYGSYYC